MLLGKGHKFLQKGRYQEALEKALKAKSESPRVCRRLYFLRG